jgi:predicted metal-dependent HD superfamily phosphohydrolase
VVLQATWTDAVCTLGGAPVVAAAAATGLAAHYAQSHRRYHDSEHVQAVLRDGAALAEAERLSARERALLVVAACAHDVVYECRPGEDEQRSAAWARGWLRRAGVAEADVTRVETLVLATAAHSASQDDHTALVLLDADLAILGADPATYDRYRLAVRAEYAAVDDQAWRSGRSAVLSGLLARQPLYATGAARQRWEAAAKANLRRELESLATE